MTTVYDVTAATLADEVERRLRDGYRIALLAGHEDDDCLRVVYVLVRDDDDRCELVLRTGKEQPTIPSLAAVDYGAGRFEREIRDLFGITPTGHPLQARL
ncbi:MAG: NADH-quinone oxidoreductase subunit C, partial [Nocardioidaceae bacterium]